MLLSFSKLNLSINICGALLLVTILNAYIIHTKFQGEAEKDQVEHWSKHIHVNKNPTRPRVPPTPDPKLLSSNNPNKNQPTNANSLGGGGLPKQDNGGDGGSKQIINDKNTIENPASAGGGGGGSGGGGGGGEHNTGAKTAKKKDLENLKKEWKANPTVSDGSSKYPRDTCLPRHTEDRTLLDLPITVVTATSEGYVGHVHNLIGSVHTHQPDAEVAVYNLGFSDETTKDLENYCGVTVHKFDFNSVPNHVQSLKNFAWKALVVKQALLDYGKIIYLDSGYEIRRPIDFIRGRIEREGYFCTGMGDSLTRGGREPMFNFFNTSTLEYLGLPMTAGGVHGATFWGGAYEGIIQPAAECSVVEKCITPDRHGEEVRSFGKDQPLFSNLVYRGGCTQCGMSNVFTAHSSMAGTAGDPFTVGKQHLFHRRGSGPFNGHGKRVATCPDRIKENFDKWQAIRSKYNTTFLGNGGCPHTRFSTKKDIDKLYQLGDVPKSIERVVDASRSSQVTLVTAGSDNDYNSLQNLVDSIQKWEPKRDILVYDLGLSSANRGKLSGNKKVEVVEFDFLEYSAHVKNVENMAWKPIVWAHAYEKAGSFIFLSSTHVLYQRLDTLIFQLQRDGIFSATIGGNMLDLYKDPDSAISFFKDMPSASQERKAKGGENLMKEFEFKPPCTAAVTGFWKDSTPAKLVIPPLLDCSLDQKCWDASTKSVGKAKYTDTMLLSLMIYDKICYTCNRDYDFYAYSGKREQLIHEEPNFPVFETALIDEIQVIYNTVSED